MSSGDTVDIERRLTELEALCRPPTSDGSATDRIQGVCDAIVEFLANGDAAAAVYLYDERRDVLCRRAGSPHRKTWDATMSLERTATPVWQAFVERDPVFVADLLPRPARPVQNPDHARGTVAPIGSHGIVLAGTTEKERPTRLSHSFTRLVGTTAGTVLDRIDDERRVDDCKRQLEASTVASERLVATNALHHDVGRTIRTAWTRADLEERVCKRIVTDERYAFARIAEIDEVTEQVCDRVQAGIEKGYLESLESDADTLADDGEPMATTIRTLETHTVSHLLGDDTGERWRRDAITRGYRSAIGVPLVFRERCYGGLVVYSDRAAAFDGMDEEVFFELGAAVAHAINALEAKTALVSRGGVELEFRVRDQEFQFLEWARETGCTFEFETVVSRPDGSIHGFFTIDGAPTETILELASQSPAVTKTHLVTERDGKQLFECTFTEDSVVAQLLEYGVVPRSISTSRAAARLVVALPESTSVRLFVDVFSRLYPDSELIRRQDHEYVARTPYGFLAELECKLTAKQLEALETAFVSGYFEVPRDATGADVAAILDISQPTFNNHLRLAQRKLLSMVFSERAFRGT
ncbi:bacterio-opsin activator domain-containing protein [Natronorubrum bangense]|uniref:Response regulator receiver modulated GAF sensor protein n=2 Tax=Natronorubrum bangense TaxID=61858 RepID=L9WAQ1_9EURY|nr:bacterio-opsin activator domain-containing protein [Natronorubrum bangense]ELY46514.1 response regulator receiver modulated GAF sensor protein [Natronorubrum bangense JCM 10635]QCC56338.1 hypothetical protein DV706_17510 [Natronorubrum bangense]